MVISVNHPSESPNSDKNRSIPSFYAVPPVVVSLRPEPHSNSERSCSVCLMMYCIEDGYFAVMGHPCRQDDVLWVVQRNTLRPSGDCGLMIIPDRTRPP